MDTLALIKKDHSVVFLYFYISDNIKLINLYKKIY